jgi:AcrR family transcriptional regulator
MATDPQLHRQARREPTRRRILAQARKALLRNGTRDFSLRQLAADLGYSPGALYLYFHGKDDLIAAVVDDAFEQLLAALQESPAADPVESLRRKLEAYVRFGLAHPDEYVLAFVRPRPASNEQLRPHAAYDLLRENVRVCAGTPAFRNLDVEAASQLLWTSMHGLTSAFIALPSFPWVDRDRLVAEMIETTIAGLRARSSAQKRSRP